jgi:hypothetical protein
MKQAWWFAAFAAFGFSAQAEDFSFDINDYQRSPWEINGHLQLSAQHNQLNADNALADLSPYQQDYWRSQGEVELGGLYRWQSWSVHGLAKAQAQQDEAVSDSEARFYEAYAHYQPNTQWQFQFGKRSLRWGKGYAFNPVAVLERAKDALDPDLAREGYVLAAADWVKTLPSGESMSMTAVLLPVSDGLNQEFGEAEQNNVAIKLGWVSGASDMDVIWRSDGSRPSALGVDFSRSLTVNWALHGEALWTEGEKILVSENGQVEQTDWQGVNLLLGTRYLTEQETTWIIEYYHQASGYKASQMETLFAWAQNASLAQLKSTLQNSAYLLPQAMQNYASIRVSQKEPFNWLYWNVGLTWMANLDDGSGIWISELIYSGYRNWEFRTRLIAFVGDEGTEYGERQNQQRFEARVRYFF